MFNTYIGQDEFVDDGKSMCFFLGVRGGESVPRSRKLYFPSLSAAAVKAVKDFPAKLLENGVSVIINPERYESQKRYVDAIQRHLAFLYAKYVVFPKASYTIPDHLGVRAGESVGSIIREWVNAMNLPLHMKYPLCDVLRQLDLRVPVLILLPGPSLAEVGPHLKMLREKCIVICIARSLKFCLEHDCAPDFVVHLDTDIKMKHLFSDDECPKTFLVSLSSANISEVSKRFAGVFFKDSFNPTITLNDYRLRESWLSCSISCLGLAEVLNASKAIVAGGDHSWMSLGDKRGHYLKEEKVIEQNFTGPIRVNNRFPCDDYDRNDGYFDSFAVPTASGKLAHTFFHYFAAAEELDSIALEYKEEGIPCAKLQESSILSNEAFPIIELDEIFSGPSIDREEFFEKTIALDSQDAKIDLRLLEDLCYETLRQVEQNTSFLTINFSKYDLRKLNQLTYFQITPDIPALPKELAEHPYVHSIRMASKTRKFQEPLRDWDAVSFAIEVSRKWGEELKKGLAFIRFQNALKAKRRIYFFYGEEDPANDLELFYSMIPKHKVVLRKIVVDGVSATSIHKRNEFPYLSGFAGPHYFFCIYTDLIADEFKYCLDLTLRYNFMTVSEFKGQYFK